MRGVLLAALVAVGLVGCAGQGVQYDVNYQAYVAAQRDIAVANAGGTQVLQIVAKKGETITFGGVESLTLTLPSIMGSGGNQIQPRVETTSEALRWASLVMPIVGSLGSIWLGGEAARGLVTATGATNTAIASQGFNAVSSMSNASIQSLSAMGVAGVNGVTQVSGAGLNAAQTLGVTGNASLTGVTQSIVSKPRCTTQGGVTRCW